MCLNEGDDKVIDRNKSRITLSIKQLEEDPLLETLEKVIPQDDSSSDGSIIDPLPGLESKSYYGIINVKIRNAWCHRIYSFGCQMRHLMEISSLEPEDRYRKYS